MSRPAREKLLKVATGSAAPLIDPHSKPTEPNGEDALPRRDWILLPIVCLLTILAITASAELLARRAFPRTNATSLNCLVLNDPSTGVRAIPNSVCSAKTNESDLIEYRFNSCGHRAGMECGPKPKGTYRIVLLGSSFAEGLWVPQEQTFAALLPADLSRRTGRKIELYNEAIQLSSPHSIDIQFKKALALQPDLILWTITNWDFPNVDLTTFVPELRPEDEGKNIGQIVSAAYRKDASSGAIAAGIRDVIVTIHQSGTYFALQHFAYESQSQYLKDVFLKGDEAPYLRAEPSAAYLDTLRRFSVYDGDIEAKAKAAGVPLVTTIIPQRGQAAMISMNQWPAGFDPYKIGDQVRSVVQSHGGVYIDILHGFRNVDDAGQYYFPVDGHPDANGHKIISNLLAGSLTDGSVPALSVAHQSDLASSQIK
jgi:hypothetical protein